MAEYCEQCSEAFGSRNGGVMNQTIINTSSPTMLHRVKGYRWFKKDILLKCHCSVLFLPVNNSVHFELLHTKIQSVKQIWKAY